MIEEQSKFKIYIPEKGSEHLTIMKMFSDVLSQENIEIEKLKEMYNSVSHIHVDEGVGKNEVVMDGLKYHKHSVKGKHRKRGNICYVYSPEMFIGRCEDDEHNPVEKKNMQGVGAYGNFEELLNYIEFELEGGIIKKPEFQEAMKPINFIEFVHDGAWYNDEVAGNDKNWDRHIKWRHKQFTENKPDKPKYLQKFGELAGWEEGDEFPNMRFKHNELPNPPNLDRSQLMCMFMSNRLSSLREKRLEDVWEKDKERKDWFYDSGFIDSPWFTGGSCRSCKHRLDESS